MRKYYTSISIISLLLAVITFVVLFFIETTTETSTIQSNELIKYNAEPLPDGSANDVYGVTQRALGEDRINREFLDGDFVDFIKPNATYQYTETDVDQDGKTFTMVFDITDKFYASGTLALEDLTILIDGEEPSWTEVDKALQVEDRTNIVNGESKVIGKRYTLRLSNLEQLQVKEGDNYLDYSGVVTVAIPANKIIDTTGNGNDATTITSGITLPGGTGTAEVVDVVQPLVEKISSSVDAKAKTATMTFKVTDKYFANSTLTNSNIQILVNGSVNNTITKQLESTPLTEQRVVNGETTTIQYGIQYTLTLSEINTNVNQIKVRIPEGRITDTSGNGNERTDLILYNTLKITRTDVDITNDVTTSLAFLGNTDIERENVDNVTFVDHIPEDVYDVLTNTFINNTAWDVSAQGDNSIIGWYEPSANGTIKVYIGSNETIFGNVNSSYLFYEIGSSSNCTATETITNIGLLNVSNVTNMDHMFGFTGETAMTSLDLGENFDTGNVTDMSYMFIGTGPRAMTSLNLGDKFDTSNVTNMRGMFYGTGYDVMSSLDLGDNFDTSNVINMSNMFYQTGYTSMTSLDLGENFNTSSVTNMNAMFSQTGYRAMTSLDLGEQFDTSKVTNMSNMFYQTGYMVMTNLDLGENFDTSSVTNMSNMFSSTGRNAMTSLDLGDKFDTSNVTDMNNMFSSTGYTSMTSLDLGEKFDTSKVTNMEYMFDKAGRTAMTSLDLGDKFNTSSVTNMTNMFYQTGYTEMTSLDLGPAFTHIAGTNTNAFSYTGQPGNITIHVPEAIYQDATHVKLNTDSTTTVEITNKTINPKYRTEWIKEGTQIDETDANNPKLNITLRGTTNTEVDATEYISDVTSTLTTEDIKVFIEDTEITDVVTKTIGTATQTSNTRTGAQDVLQVLTLSNFEEAVRQTGTDYKEWSGNIRVEVAQGTLGDTTGPADEEGKKIPYGNKNMEVASTDTQTGATTGAGAVTEIGARIDNIIQDTTKVDQNTANAMFTDFIKPEFTYLSANTEILHGDEEKVTIVFDVVDKFFESTTLSNLDASQITVQIDDYDVAELNANITKELTKVQDLTATVEGVENTKIGERYQLVITGLDQENEDGVGDGYTYSGYMTLSFAQGTVTDKSGNTNSAKSITIGKDEPGGADGDEEIVDVVDPVWSIAEVNTDEEIVKIRVKDKFLNKDQSILNLTEDAITIVVNGTPSTAIATILDGPTEIVPNEEYEYTITLENVTPPDAGYVEFTPVEPIVGGTAQYKEDNGGYIALEIAAGVVTDQYGNETNKQTLEVGNLDKTKPEVFDVQKTQDKANGKETLVFNVTDKNYDPSDPVTLDELTIWMDGVQIDDQIVKNLVSTVEIKANIDGEVKVVGHQYTLEINEIVETDEEFIGSGRDYRELSGSLEIRIDPEASRDMSGNTIKEETATITDFVDLIDPEVIYQYSTSDIDYDGKTFTMVFDIADKYYTSGALAIEDLAIRIDGEEPDWTEVIKSLQVEDKTSMVNGESKVIGQTYTLTLSNLEQLQVKEGDNYLDYSGVVTVAIPADKIMDTAGNGNTATTITSGINLPGGEASDEKLVDVVDPLIEKISSSVNVDAKTADISFKVTDKYFANSTLTNENIQILVNGSVNNTITKEVASISLTEQRVVDGTTSDVQYGVQYALTLSGIDTTVNQIKVRVTEGLVTDTSGNGNKQTDLIVFNTLRYTRTETGITSAFLGNSNIQRQNVDNVTFVDDIPEDVYDIFTNTFIDSTAWDVSAQGDNSIIAWYEENDNGTVKVYIGSNDEMFGNVDSSYLFGNIGYSNNCTATETITNIGLLNVSNVTNMSYMFYSTGNRSMTSLDLGDNFDTSNVTNMSYMFSYTGYTAMTSLDLGENFDTRNVTDMNYMFYSTGYSAMTSLDLGENFDTRNVTNMRYMFYGTGRTAMTSLDLGDKFDTSKVTDMRYMFAYTGRNTMTSLDLGDKFDTSSVTNMSRMFQYTGYTVMTSLDLGPAFTNIASSNTNMFDNTGKSGEIVIQAPEAIYQNSTNFKLNTSSSTTIEFTRGTINPKYRTEWLKEGTAIDETDTNNPKLNITLRGTTNQEVDPAEYISDVTSTLTSNDIKVFIDDTEITDIVTKTIGTATQTPNTRTGATDVLQVLTLSNFEEAVRQTGKDYKEWSGNIRVEVAQGTLGDTTGPADETGKKITYGNKNMEVASTDTQTGATTGAGAVTEIGARIDNIVQDTTKVDQNTTNAMFADFIKPEFTYRSQNTEILHGDEEKVTIEFDVVDKFFESTTLSNLDASQITVQIDDYDVAELNQNITKQLIKVQDITGTVEGVENTKIGERYQLVITGLDQEDADGNGDGYHYSGYMTLSFAQGTVTDKSGNTNSAKSITIGKDEPGGADGDEEVVDVVDPVWSISEIDEEAETVKIRVKDKFLNKDESIFNMTEDAITIIVNGTPSTAIATILEGPTEIIPNEEYEYTITLENVTPDDGGYTEFTPVEPIVGGTAQYKNDNGGHISLEIAPGAVTDQYGNASNKQVLDVGNIDKTTLEVYEVQKNQDETQGKETIIFNVTDKNYDPSDPVTLDEITTWIDGEQIDDQVTKQIISTVEIKANIDGEIKVLGHQYTLEISEIVETDEEFVGSGRDYRELSGNLEVRIDPNASRDIRGNTINPETTTITDFIDFIKPEVRYQYNTSDIDYDGKTFTMVFDVADKYYTSGTLTIEDLNILIDGEEPNWDDTGVHGVVRTLTEQDITATINGESKTVGKHYTLKLSHLEQLEKLEGKETMDYSGIITVAIPANKIMDTTGHGNVATTITSGLNILAGDPGEATVVDVVDPIWEKVDSTVDVDNKTITTTVKATDKYFTSSNLTADNIKVLINGAEVSKDNIDINIGAKTAASTTDGQDVIGDQYTITLSGDGLDFSSNQIKIQIAEGTATDQSGNTNKVTDLILFNTLRNTSTEIENTSAFLGNTNIQRQNVDNVTFVDNIPSDVYDFSAKAYVDSTAWDVSAAQDNSIIAWYETNANGTYKVYIGSNDEIFGNVDSTRLFSYIGYASNCTSTETITNIGLLNVSNVTNMRNMFSSTGYTAMTSLDLGDKFDTSNVTDMTSMFSSTGYTAMTSLEIGDNFDTSSVTDMSYMFNRTGYTAMTSLDLGDKFDTSNVINMSYMFDSTGYRSMTSLELGENFDTSNVQNMSYMFGWTGYESMMSLDLGDKFDTENVTDMSCMFISTGYRSMTSLDLGDKFDTSNVTTMNQMFSHTGCGGIISLDLGDKFDTSSVTNMTNMFNLTGSIAMTNLDLGPAFTNIASTNSTNMFNNTGKSGEIVIQAPEAIYQNSTNFKLGTDSSTTIEFANGTINPKYRTEWIKEEAEIDETDANNPKLNITLRGTTNQEVDPAEYISDVTSTLTSNDIKVFIDDTEITDVVTKTIGTATQTPNTRTGAQDVLQVLTLSNFEEAVRRTGIPYKEWSGNIRVEVAQGSLSDTTGPADETGKKITYGNKNMEVASTDTQTGATTGAGAVTEIGARIDNIIQDEAKVDKNTTDAMFTDFINPEFTYRSQDTEIIHGDEEKVTIVFDVVDKFFESTTLSNLDASQITVSIDDYDVTALNNAITKELTKVQDITGTVEGVENTKIGERYQLVITGLDQEDENGLGDGYTYSGYMTLSFAQGTVTDKSGNISSAKSISIGKDDPGGQDGDEEVVDVVDPIWTLGDVDGENGIVKLRVKDKFLNQAESIFDLTTDDITIIVNGEVSTEIGKVLSGPVEIIPNEEYEYTLSLTNITPDEKGYTEFTPVEPIVGDTAQYRNENGGNILIEIAEGVITDQYENTTGKQTFELGDIDGTGPEVYDVQKTHDEALGKDTIVFNVTDKNYDSSDPVTLDELTVWMDGIQIDDQITKQLISTVEIKTNIDGEVKVVGHQYTLEISEIVETDEEFLGSGRDYRELSGTLEVRIDPNASSDIRGNTINDETTTITDFVDFIKPEVRYTYNTSDIDYDGKTFTMEFNIVDKYLNEATLDVEDLNILIDGEEPNWDDTGVHGVVRELTEQDITGTVNGTTKTVGKRYTLKLSHLEQLEKLEGKETMDYSGIITVAIPSDVVVDTAGNGNNATTITSGINILAGEVGEAVTVDVVDPIWEKVSSSVDVDAKTATAVVRATDKFFASSNLTADNIKVLVNGAEVSKDNISINIGNKVTAYASNGTDVIGDAYTITLSGEGLDFSSNQIKIQIAEGTATDQSGNANKATDIIVFNTLRNTATEVNAIDAFLGNTNIRRQNIDNVTFVDNIPSDVYDFSAKTYVDSTAWDVSAQGDNSIIAWYETNENGTIKVYIGSNDEIFGNVDSCYLFAHIGYASNCTSAETITNISLLNTSNVTNMNYMFYNTGYKAMINLDLGDNFDTSNVNSMERMFYATGYNVMTNLDLGDNFDTSNVITMRNMFSNVGQNALTSLDLKDKFNTSNVTDMYGMFANAGQNAMTSLDLGDNFDTSRVTTMNGMFSYTGFELMTGLDLGEKFDTSNVTDMNGMFANAGQKVMTSLDLGEKFYTTKVTDMSNMFNGTGLNAMTSLDLGPAFTHIAEANTNMFNNTGKQGEIVIQAPESIYNDRTHFKLNTDSSTTIGWTQNGAETTTYGTINPKYKPEWQKVSSTINEETKEVAITIKGQVDPSVYTSNANGQFPEGELTGEQANLLNVYIDGELAENITKSISAVTETTDGTTGMKSVQYTITLSNFEEALRQVGKNFKEWSGNIALQPVKGTLVDDYGNKNMEAMDTEHVQTADGEEFEWMNIELKDADTDRNTDGTMFADYIKPEFTYETYDTTIDYDQKNVNIIFDVTDKYFESTTLTQDMITITVDETQLPEDATITKTLTKVTQDADVVDGNITYKANGDIYYTVDGVEKKVGERYQLLVEGLESENGEGYSGPMSLSFPAGIITDTSGNQNDAKTITLGIDEPENPDHPDHDEPIIVDVVNPLWEYLTSSIDRENETVTVTILGTDQYYQENTLTTDNIHVYLTDSETPDEEVTTISKNLVQVDPSSQEYTDLLTQAQGKGLDNIGVIYKLTLGDYGELSGATKVVLDAETITDTSGNTNIETEIPVGNPEWVEEGDDPENPIYTAFRNNIVDFINPSIKYTYSDVEGSTNPDIDYEAKILTVKFTVTDKYIRENSIMNPDGTMNTENIRIKVAGTDLTDQLHTTVTSSDIPNGTEYTFVVSNFELVYNEANRYQDYSGAVDFVFAGGKVDDTSGNKNTATTITLDYDDGDDTDNPVIVDVIDPLVERTDDNLSIVNANNGITRDLDTETGIVSVRIRATDKYLGQTTLQDAENVANMRVKVVKPNGETVYPDTIVKQVAQVSKTATAVTYQITLSNFEDNQGITSIIIPEGVITDQSGNTNQETEILVGNATWTETGDINGEYTAFRESIVDFTRPTWEYADSSITRDRAGETGTVTVKILGRDDYFLKDTLTTDNINVYVDNSENPDTPITTITKTLTKITDEAELDGADVGYELTLGNFGSYDGAVKFEIAENTIRDTSGIGNKVTQIPVGNPNWVETDVGDNVDNPKYTAFRNNIVDFIKPTIEYQYQEGVNPVIDQENKQVTIYFDAVDTNFLESDILTVDDIEQILVDGMDVTDTLTKELTMTDITADEGTENPDGTGSSEQTGNKNGIRYTLTLSNFELPENLENEIFRRHSGKIEFVIAENKVRDTSGNANIETKIIVDNDDGDDENNYIIADFINPKLYYKDKFISYAERYATVTISGTDRFYDFNTSLTPEDISIYELNRDGEYIQRTDLPITITPVRNAYGYDFVIRFDEFEEEFKQLKISIPAGIIRDTEGHSNEATDIYVDLDNKKPVWRYESTDTSEFESNGKISFTVKGQDTFLVQEESNLEAGDIRIIKDGVDITNADNITVQPVGEDADEISETYQIDVTGLTEIGTYSLVIAKDTLVDEFDNYSNATTISFSKSAISSNTENYTNVTYHVTPDFEQMHQSYVHELMNVTTSGTNEGSSVYRASSIGEIYGNGDNNAFAEPFTYENGVQTAYSFAGWAEADERGVAIENGEVYDLYTDIPNTVTNLRAVWQEATVIFVSNNGNNANNGLSPTTPVQDLTTAYSKLNASGNASNNIIVIMDAIEWNSSERLVGNATITSLYAGVDYRTSGAELKISSNMDIQGDITFDNINLYADSTNVSDGSDYLATGDYTNVLVTNYGDVTLGRGISTPEGKYTFGGVVGGNYKEEETTGTIGNHRVIVEAGRYNDIIIGSSLNSQSPTRKYVSHEVILGTMKESAIARNDKLVITGYLAMGELEDRCYPYNPEGTQDTDNAYNRIYATTQILSGTFTGENKFHKASEDAVMYLRSINGYNDGQSQLDIYGGNLTGNIYGGARMATSKDESADGEADVNYLHFYGGQINGNIFGHGGNDTSTGNSIISLQGATQITGNIFGGSNTTTAEQGRVTGNTNITVNSTITVTGNIYGGSNGVINGTNINLNTGLITGDTNITLNNGAIITGDVYGGGNNAGVTGNANITVNNGQVLGSVYGGAYQNQVRTESNIQIFDGILNDIYGGNVLTTQAQLNADTSSQNVNITIGDASKDTTPTINGTIYGSGKYDRVGTVNIQLVKCATAPTIYGGSEEQGTTNEVDIYLNGMTANTIYGGSKTDGTVTTSNIYLATGTVTDVYGGGFGGTTTTANIYLNEAVLPGEDNPIGGNANVTNIYGGSNTNGTVGTSNVNLSLGNVTNVFGGGNGAGVGTANVNLDGITIDTIFGGSKNAGVTTNTNVQLNSGTVTNVFGGGYDTGVTNANVTQNGATVTNIFGGNQGGTGDGGETTNATININNATAQNIYGGNQNKGITRNATINITGTSVVNGELYGGGLGTDIGRSDMTGSTTINITGGTIMNDINGGSKNATVYGTTNINIGKDAVTNDALTAGNIVINGNIYGSGDSENEDYNTVSVYGETHILMDNSGESPITFTGRIFGAGKDATYSSTASDGTDKSTVILKDFGTSTQSYTMTSIERTGKVTIDNSYLELLGAQDEQNYYQKTSYTLNRITNGLTLQNNTTLYTQRGFNMVGGFESLLTNADGSTSKETATIADGAVTRNVDNRIYTLEGVNLIFAKAEGDLTDRNSEDIWGDVNGMAFFGMYRHNRNTGNKEYDIYAPNGAGTATTNMFGVGTYIEGRHKPNHDTTVDGFYTNVVSEGATTATPQVIEVTDYGTYYDWIIGAQIVNYDAQVIASIFGTEATAELALDFDSFVDNATYSGTTFSIDRVSTNALNTDVNLINKLQIPTYSENANTTFGFTMQTSNSGWQQSGETNIYTDGDGSFDGDTVFKTDNSNTAGTLLFKIFNSVNISETKDLGYVNIVLTGKAKSGEDASMGNTFKVVIAVNLQTEQTPNIENYIPTFTNSSKTKLSYTTDSQVDITYVLYKEVNGQQSDFYANGDYRVLSTTMPLPQGTGITIRDYGQGDDVNKVYYYQVASDTDYDATDNSSGTTRYLYNLSDFVEMGGTATTDKYANDNSLYYHEISTGFGYALEKYDVSIDFKDSNISADQLAQETYLELRNSTGAVKYDNGETQIVYDLYNKNAIMTETVTTDDGKTAYSVYNNLTIPFTFNASIVEQTTADGQTIQDTKYYDKYTGMAIEIVDEHGERIKAPAVQNLRVIDQTTSTVYRVGTDGVIRIPLSAGLSTIQNQYQLALSQSSVPAGVYSAKIYFFASDDGSHYGGEVKQEQEIRITFINKLLGLAGLESVDGSRIINKTTRMNLVQGDGLDLTVKVGSPTNDTNIRVELYKRNDTYTTQEDGTNTYNPIGYTQVDLKDYLENLNGTEWKTPEDYAGQDLVTADGCKEYVLMEKKEHPTVTEGENIETIDFDAAIKEGISTGEYKLVFKAYYNNTLIQTIRKSFIVVP